TGTETRGRTDRAGGAVSRGAGARVRPARGRSGSRTLQPGPARETARIRSLHRGLRPDARRGTLDAESGRFQGCPGPDAVRYLASAFFFHSSHGRGMVPPTEASARR